MCVCVFLCFFWQIKSSLCLCVCFLFAFFRSSAVFFFFLRGRDPHKREFWITRNNNNNNNENDNEKRKQKRDVYHDDDDECDDDDVENVHANDGDDVFFENDSLEISDKKDEQKLPRVLEKWWFSSTKSKSWGKILHRNNVTGGGQEIAQLADWDEETITTVIAAVLGIGAGLGIPIFFVTQEARDKERIEEIRELNRATLKATGEQMSEEEIKELRPNRYLDRREFKDDD